MSEHTPTPWYSSPATGIEGETLFLYIHQGKGGEFTYTLASTCSADTLGLQKANAAFIVRACKSHEALVEALEAIVKADESGSLDDVLFENARAALKLAGAA